MAEYITKDQYRQIENTSLCGVTEFYNLLEKYTDIEAKPYTAYLYYDECGNFIGNSDDATLERLLEAAYVEVK